MMVEDGKGTGRKRTVLPGIFAFLTIALLEFLITACVYRRSRSGGMISVRLASGRPAAFLFQCLLEFLLPAALLILFALVLKKRFPEDLCFRLQGRWQRITAACLAAAVMLLTAYGLIVKTDRVGILLSLFYYLVIIGFGEEFIIHDACAWFLRDTAWPLRYLLPNTLFGVLHLFLAAGWGEISGEVLLRFLFSGTFLGYVFSGCLFQFLKEKSGSIWVPVLLHGLMDYTAILKY